MKKSYIQKDPRVPNQTAVRTLNLAIHDIIGKQKEARIQAWARRRLEANKTAARKINVPGHSALC
jgi:hypothetical protein